MNMRDNTVCDNVRIDHPYKHCDYLTLLIKESDMSGVEITNLRINFKLSKR